MGVVNKLMANSDSENRILGGRRHRQDIGNIDVIWGADGPRGYGLAHIMEAHPDVVGDLPDLIASLPATRGNSRIILQDDTHRVVLSETFHDQQKRWVVTAFQKGGPNVQTSRREHLTPDGGSTDTGLDADIGDR